MTVCHKSQPLGSLWWNSLAYSNVITRSCTKMLPIGHGHRPMACNNCKLITFLVGKVAFLIFSSLGETRLTENARVYVWFRANLITPNWKCASQKKSIVSEQSFMLLYFAPLMCIGLDTIGYTIQQTTVRQGNLSNLYMECTLEKNEGNSETRKTVTQFL